MGLLQSPVVITDVSPTTISVAGAGINRVLFNKSDISITRSGNQGNLFTIQQNNVEVAFYAKDVTIPYVGTADQLEAWLNSMASANSSGDNPFSFVSNGELGASIKGSSGILKSLIGINTGTRVFYLKLYDKATEPDPDIDVPVQIIPIPYDAQGAGLTQNFGPDGLLFTKGIGMLVTKNIAITDSSPANADEVSIAITYN